MGGIADVLREVEDSLKQRANEKQTERDRIVGEKPLRASEVEEASEKRAVQTSEVHRLKVVLAEKATAFRIARSALGEAEHAKLLDGQKGNAAEKKKGDFTAALDNLTVLKTASPEDADVQRRLRNLMGILKKCDFDESMLIALPSALGKAPDARGRFDLIAISQLESKVETMVAEQTAILDAAAPGQAKCDAAIRDAEVIFSAARNEQMAAAKMFDVASQELATCEATHKSAQKAARDHAQSQGFVQRALHNAKADLEIFQQGPLETFKALCCRVTPLLAEEVMAVVRMEDVDAAVVMEESGTKIAATEVPAMVPIVPVVA